MKCGYKVRNSDSYVNKKEMTEILNGTDNMKNVDSNFEDKF